MKIQNCQNYGCKTAKRIWTNKNDKIGDNIDFQPCGGTHVNKTSEIDYVKSVKIENKGKMNKRIILNF